MPTFHWTYVLNGTGEAGTVNLTTTSSSYSGPYTVTAASGTWNGNAITGLLAAGSFQGNDNTLTNAFADPDYLDTSGFSFQTTDGLGQPLYVNVYMATSGSYSPRVNTAASLTGPAVTTQVSMSVSTDADQLWSYDVSALGVEGVFTVTTGLGSFGNDPYSAQSISGTWGGHPILGLVGGALLGLAAPYKSSGYLDGLSEQGGITFSTTDAAGQPENVQIQPTGDTAFSATETVEVSSGTDKSGNPIYPTSTAPAAINTYSTTACFLRGTSIETTEGAVAVEALRPGQFVVLARGGAAEIRWVGCRTVDCAANPDPAGVLPVRVTAGAFGAGLPRRDLYLSPEHAVFHSGVLVPVRALVDGSAIRQVAASLVQYYHVQLDAHDVILAEGLPVESYLEGDSHAAFDNGADAPVSLSFLRPCAPIVSQGTVVEAVRSVILRKSAIPAM